MDINLQMKLEINSLFPLSATGAEFSHLKKERQKMPLAGMTNAIKFALKLGI